MLYHGLRLRCTLTLDDGGPHVWITRRRSARCCLAVCTSVSAAMDVIDYWRRAEAAADDA